MTFQVGSLVRWNATCHLRLGHSLSDIGVVVGLRDNPGQDSEIDVEFDNGDVVHGAVESWFERAEAPASRTEQDELEVVFSALDDPQASRKAA
jgi:hypothetical protein